MSEVQLDDEELIDPAELAELAQWVLDETNKPQELTPVYVFFDPDTGRIVSISNNERELEMPCISITDADMQDKLSSIESFYKFKVIFDLDQKKNTLVDVNLSSEKLTINDLTMKYDRVENPSDEDIVVAQDNINEEWVITLSEPLVTQFEGNPVPYDYLNLFVTRFNDPNILYRSITVPFKTLATGGHVTVKYTSISEKDEVSIFSRKYFTKHGHIVK